MVEARIKLSPQQYDIIGSKAHDIIVSGSAGSGKSFWAALKTVLYAQNTPNAVMLATRKFTPQLMKSCHKEVLKILKKLKIPYYNGRNDSDSVIRFSNGATLEFEAVYSLNKFRSTEYDFIWIEQAEEINYLDYMELMRRLRGAVGGDANNPDTYLQCIITATPEDESHWMFKTFYETDEFQPVHFDYKQNIHLPKDYIQGLEQLKKIDPELYNKYALGQWGKLTNNIYPNWQPCLQIPEAGKPWENMPKPDYLFGGLDWGYNNPSAFVLLGYDGKHIFIIDEVYKTLLTNTEFLSKVVKRLKLWGIEPVDLDVWGDASEPARLKEFHDEGFNTYPGLKEPLTRIDRVKQQRVYYSPACIKTIAEQKKYKWMVDKNNEVLDRPVKFDDHAMDAIGYAVVGMTDMFGIVKDIDPYLIVGGGGGYEETYGEDEYYDDEDF